MSPNAPDSPPDKSSTTITSTVLPDGSTKVESVTKTINPDGSVTEDLKVLSIPPGQGAALGGGDSLPVESVTQDGSRERDVEEKGYGEAETGFADDDDAEGGGGVRGGKICCDWKVTAIIAGVLALLTVSVGVAIPLYKKKVSISGNEGNDSGDIPIVLEGPGGTCELDRIDHKCGTPFNGASFEVCFDEDVARTTCNAFVVDDSKGGATHCCKGCAVCPSGCQFDNAFDCTNINAGYLGQCDCPSGEEPELDPFPPPEPIQQDQPTLPPSSMSSTAQTSVIIEEDVITFQQTQPTPPPTSMTSVTQSPPILTEEETAFGHCGLDNVGAIPFCEPVGIGSGLEACLDVSINGDGCSSWIRDKENGTDMCCQGCLICPPECRNKLGFDCSNLSLDLNLAFECDCGPSVEPTNETNMTQPIFPLATVANSSVSIKRVQNNKDKDADVCAIREEGAKDLIEWTGYVGKSCDVVATIPGPVGKYLSMVCAGYVKSSMNFIKVETERIQKSGHIQNCREDAEILKKYLIGARDKMTEDSKIGVLFANLDMYADMEGYKYGHFDFGTGCINDCLDVCSKLQGKTCVNGEVNCLEGCRNLMSQRCGGTSYNLFERFCNQMVRSIDETYTQVPDIIADEFRRTCDYIRQEHERICDEVFGDDPCREVMLIDENANAACLGQCDHTQLLYVCEPWETCCQNLRQCIEGECCSNADCASGICDDGKCSCIHNGQCAEGRFCFAGSCVECFTDSDCGSGRTCVIGEAGGSGYCDECRSECCSDQHCGVGGQCCDGQCVDPRTQCCTDRDCGSGSTCCPEIHRCADESRGECCECARWFVNFPDNKFCASEICAECLFANGDADCGPGERCRPYRGRDDIEGGKCEKCEEECCADEDCGANGQCCDGKCIDPRTECCTDSDCGSGSTCCEGNNLCADESRGECCGCVAKDNKFCAGPNYCVQCLFANGDADCDPGETCEPYRGYDIEGGYCKECRDECCRDRDCGLTGQCCNGKCISKSQCCDDGDCGWAGTRCIAASCYECSTRNGDSDCGRNEVCNSLGLSGIPEAGRCDPKGACSCEAFQAEPACDTQWWNYVCNSQCLGDWTGICRIDTEGNTFCGSPNILPCFSLKHPTCTNSDDCAWGWKCRTGCCGVSFCEQDLGLVEFEWFD